MPAVGDVAEFLRHHPPFDLLNDAELEQIAGRTEIAFHPAGETLFAEGTAVDCVWVVRTGSIDIVSGEAVLDVAGEGELVGQTSMLSGLPTVVSARAAEDTLVYRIPEEAAQPLLSRPRALGFLVRSMLPIGGVGANHDPAAADPLRRTVGSLLRMPLVTCEPDDPVREVARRMTALGVSAVIVGGRPVLGIVTDTDLRTHVVEAGVDPGAPVTAVMSSPVVDIPADSSGADALLEMLARGIQHLPVTDPTGRLLGVLEHHDLVAAEARTPLVVRRRIARATTVDELAEAAHGLSAAAISLRDSGAGGEQVSALWSVVLDALTVRLIELSRAASSDPDRRLHLARARQHRAARGCSLLGRRQRPRLVRLGHRRRRPRARRADRQRGERGPGALRLPAGRARPHGGRPDLRPIDDVVSHRGPRPRA